MVFLEPGETSGQAEIGQTQKPEGKGAWEMQYVHVSCNPREQDREPKGSGAGAEEGATWAGEVGLDWLPD